MATRGLSTEHRVNLTESFFLGDLRYGDPKPRHFPLWIKLPATFIASGFLWACVIVFWVAVREALYRG